MKLEENLTPATRVYSLSLLEKKKKNWVYQTDPMSHKTAAFSIKFEFDEAFFNSS